MYGLFITGIDTGVGKTYVTSLLARCLRQRGVSVGIYKPACSGAERNPANPEQLDWPDLNHLSAALADEFPIHWICPQKFTAPLAPPAAAALENREVDPQLLRSGIDVWRGHVDVLLVEGIGGWLAPVTQTETVANLAIDFGFPVLTITENRLGMINHTLLTLNAIQNSGLPLCGVVVNQTTSVDDGTRQSNPDLLRLLTSFPIFGPLNWEPSPVENTSVAEQLDPVLEYCVERKWFPATTGSPHRHR